LPSAQLAYGDSKKKNVEPLLKDGGFYSQDIIPEFVMGLCSSAGSNLHIKHYRMIQPI